MTVEKVSIKPRRVSLTANGVLTDFDFDFKIFDENDILVYVLDTDDVATLQTITTDYTVEFDSEAETGTVTFLTAPTDQYTVLMISNADYEQSTDIPKGGGFSEPVVEKGYDLLAIQIQQLKDGLDRAVTLAETSLLSSVTLPDAEPGAAIGWNDAGDGLTNDPDGVNQVAVDTDANPDFLGAASNDGVLRVSGLLSYTDGGDYITIGLTNALIDHDQLTNFVADEHIAHSTVTITGGGILSGGGAINASQVITLAHSDVDHDQTTNFVANEHVDHGAVSIITTANTSGLAGGGDLTASRTLVVDIANTTAGTVAANDLVLIADIDDSNNLKAVTATSIAALAGAGGTNVEIEDEGISLTTAVTKINFVGAGVTATEPVADEITVTIPGGGGGATLDHDVNQTTHGFSVGDWIYHNGTIYALADASAATTAESIGVVSAVTDANNFTVQFGGRITGLSGLTAGEAHFLSETAGQITATAPATEDAVIKPVLIADSTTSGFIFNMRGIAVTSTTSFYQSFTNADLSAGVLTLNHNLGHKYCQVQIFNNSDKMIMPDYITLTDNDNAAIDLTSFGTLTGTWHAVVLDVGTTDAFTNTSYSQSFADGDLTAGVLSVVHGMNTQDVIVQVFDNNNDLVQPDDITATNSTTVDVDLTSYGTLTGTWNVVILSGGATAVSSTATDLQLAGQAAEDFAIFDGTNWLAKGGTEKIKVGTFTRNSADATGTQAITGLGFRPSFIEVLGGQDNTAEISWGIGDGTSGGGISDRHLAGSDTYGLMAAGQVVIANQGGGNSYVGTINSLDSDGFTISWTRNGTPTGTLSYTYVAHR